ncbi:hypothetical protein ABZ837_37300 [Streptomyces sp. NPDC047197]|uniref:hypothetical protein n=1 Tax=Streptomyces sp. NPDC047197 TaxID=3155477 RepID=UPI003407D9CB
MVDEFAATDRTAVIAEASTRLILELLGWRGRMIRSSEFTVRASLRLADLAMTTKTRAYLCAPAV